MKTKAPWLILSVVLLLGVFAYLLKGGALKPTSFEPSQLDKLVMKLEGQYVRAIDKNGYSIHYAARPPHKVLITVKHYPNVDRQKMYQALESAKSLIRGISRDLFEMQHVEIDVDVEWVELPAPVSRSP